ncbi:MAG TPA: TonB-dependent receptor, partial [Terriglobales bacterium]|nr:TonB-dependent receptor [Terriglobales bacterium]
GANLPGYGSNVGQRFQQYNLSHTWTLTNALVNEARFTYMREGQLTFQHPQNTAAVTSSCPSSVSQFCFTGTSDSAAVNDFITGTGLNPAKAGITPGLGSNHEGLPFITINGGGVIGNNFEGELPQVGNTFQWADNLSWIKGNHTMKFGADVRRSRFDQTLYYNVNGSYTFDSSGADAVSYADNYPGFLLGLADVYSQGSAQRENIRSTGVYLFAQDSWKIKPNLTLNYGLRWELTTPLTDVLHHVQTFRPGQNTTVYPCQLNPDSIGTFQGDGIANPNCDNTGTLPTGLVVPGDKGIPAGMTSTYYKAFAPRIGLAWSPDDGKTSIRTGFGLFYNPMEQLVMEQFGAEPPFGGSNYLVNVFFNTPFVEYDGGQTLNPNPFNGILSPAPGTPIDWSTFRSLLLYGEFQPHLRTQYTAQYNLNIQRELAKNLVFSIGYVGSQGHRLLASHDLNPGNPQTCLDLQAMSDAFAASNPHLSSSLACGPYYADSAYTIPAGTVLPNALHLPYVQNNSVIPAGTTVGPNGINLVGLRPYSSPNCNPLSGTGCPADGIPVFANIFAEDTIANSSYNSLQTSLEKRFSHGLQFQAAYTWSKSLDQASSFEETLNPFNFGASRALSLFNAAHRFVINYYWDIPVPKYEGFRGKLLDDWSISGITQFQSGFPIRLQTQDDNELISSLFFIGTAAPQQTGSLQTQNPNALQTLGGQTGHFYLNPGQFSDPALGTFSTTPRSICCGPGLNNWDITISKRIAVDEARYFQFRADIFNLANHTEWVNPDGNFSNTTFGQVLNTRDPRLVQFALKFYF